MTIKKQGGNAINNRQSTKMSEQIRMLQNVSPAIKKLSLLSITVLFSGLFLVGGVGAAPAITDWFNNVTNDNSLSFTMNETDLILFNITANETVDYTWYQNGTTVGSNQDNWTWITNSSTDGDWNVTVIVNKTNETDSKEWKVTVKEEIQVLIDGLSSTGGVVNLENKTYDVKTVIEINKSNVWVIGGGTDKTILLTQDPEYFTGYAMFYVHDVANITIKNVNLTVNTIGSILNTAGGGIWFLDVNDSTIDNISVYRFNRGVETGNGTNDLYPSHNLTINNSIFTNNRAGIRFLSTDSSIIENNIVSGSQSSSGIQLNDNNQNNTIRNNVVFSSINAGINVYANSGRNTLYNNTVYANQFGIWFNGGHYNNATNNKVYSNRDCGIISSGSSSSNNTKIENNIIYNNGKDGICIRSLDIFKFSDHVIIRSNTIFNNSDNGIWLNMSNYTVTTKNNIIANNSGCGLSESSYVTGGDLNSSYNLIYGHSLDKEYCGGVSYSNDIYVDPLFADPANGDFHLKSYDGRWNSTDWVTDSFHSPAIDAGDPSSYYSNEPAPHGSRINIGAHGGTVYASKSFSNTSNVTGNITNTAGSAIDGVTVSIASITNTTNSTGDYVLSDVPLGNFNITASKAGYYDNSTGVNVVAPSTIKNLVLTPDTEPPDITFFPPTPNDGDNVSSNYIFINVTISETADWTALEWNGTNESMQGSGTSWYRNMTNLANGTYSFRVWANDFADNLNVSVTRNVTVNNSDVTDTVSPSIAFTNPSPSNGTKTSDSSVYVNTSISDVSDVSSFIDWNRSLTGYWRFEGDSGSTVTDSSLYGNNGTNYGAVKLAGKFGNALNFDSINDYVEIENPDLSLTDEITIEVWVKPVLGSIATIAARYVYDRSVPVNDRSFELELNEGGNVEFALSSDGTFAGTIWLTSSGVVIDNAWNHIVATSDGTTMKIYINGVQDSQTASAPSTIHSPDRPLQIGVWEYGINNETEYFFNGQIDEVKIHNRALSSDEINASYDSKLYSLEHDFTSLDDGSYSYYACAQDTAGNYNCTETRVVTTGYQESQNSQSPGGGGTIKTKSLSKTLPTIKITSPQNTTYNSILINLDVSADETIDTWWYEYNANGTNITFTPNTTLIAGGTDGLKNITVYANDSTGNLNYSAVYFTLDTTKPTITVASPQNTSYNTTSISLDVSADETIDTWWYEYNANGTNITFTPNTTLIAGGTDGLKNITVYANDSTGNLNYSAVYFTLDTTKPKTTSTFNASTDNPAQSEGRNTGVVVVLVSAGIAGVAYYFYQKKAGGEGAGKTEETKTEEEPVEEEIESEELL